MATVVISTLMVLISQSGDDFSSLWEQTGSVNDGNLDKHTLALYDVIADGSFRSARIDQWASEAYDEISLQGTNVFGDVLWETVFNATGTTSSLTSWMDTSLMIFTSATSTAQQTIITNDANYRMRIGPTLFPEKTWFAISYGQLSYGTFPVVFTTRYANQAFNHPIILDGALGCWKNTFLTSWTFMYTDAAVNAPAKCINTCKATASEFTVAMCLDQRLCYCAIYNSLSPPVEENAACFKPCPGDSSAQCGGFDTDIGNAYHIPGENLPGTVGRDLMYQGSINDVDTVLHFDLDTALGTTSPHFVTYITIDTDLSHVVDYTLNYSVNACSQGQPWRVYQTSSGTTFSADNILMKVDILLIRCLQFTFGQSLSGAIVDISIYGPTSTSDHVEVPAVVIQGIKYVATTTTTTTPTTTTTTPTTTTTTPTTTTTTPTTTTTTPTTTTTTPTTTTPTTTTTTPTTTTTTSITTTTMPTTTTTPTTTFKPPPATTTTPSIATMPTKPVPSTTTPTPAPSTTTTPTPAPTTTTTPTPAPSTTNGESTTPAVTTTTKVLCQCPCNTVVPQVNLTAKQIQTKIETLQKELAVNVSTLSSTVRKLTSAEDKRASAVSIGFFGVGLLVAVFGSIVFIDSAMLLRDLKSLVSNIKTGLCRVRPPATEPIGDMPTTDPVGPVPDIEPNG